MADVTISLSDSGKRIDVQVGDVLEIRLPENPTTGYRWQISTHPLLVVENDEYLLSPGGGIGGGGQRLIRLRVAAPGSSRVQAANRRQWEEEIHAVERFAIDVDVR